MSENLSDQPSQERIFDIAQTLTKIVKNSVVVAALEHTGITPDAGWGLHEYRAGRGILSSTPEREGDTPAEISYYPEVDDIDVSGAIYWHGKESHALEKGKLVSFHLEDTLEEGHYTEHLEIQMRNFWLVIGRPDPDRRRGERTLLPPKQETILTAEFKLAKLLEHLEAKEAEAAALPA